MRVIVQVIPAQPAERRWVTIGDDQLLAALAQAGQPSGMVRLNGQAILVRAQ